MTHPIPNVVLHAADEEEELEDVEYDEEIMPNNHVISDHSANNNIGNNSYSDNSHGNSNNSHSNNSHSNNSYTDSTSNDSAKLNSSHNRNLPSVKSSGSFKKASRTNSLTNASTEG